MAGAARPLALHQITALDADPARLVEIAALTGCEGVCVFTHMPARAPFPVVDANNKGAVLAAMQRHGVAVTNVEFFPVKATTQVADFRAGLALGAELGAARAVCHIHDPERDRAAQTLAQLADLAAEHGLGIGIEFMGMTPGCNSLGQAAWFMDQIGRPNAGIAVDMLHLMRTGGTAADLAALASHSFAYAQICDGHGLHRSDDYMAEALSRALPGDGDFPLQDIIAALPQTCALDIEVPCPDLAARGISALAWALDAVARSRALVAGSAVLR